jgi:hypothetical protein
VEYPSDREALVVRAWELMESESPTEMVPFRPLSSSVPSHRKSEILIEPLYPRLGLLGGAPENGGKLSKLAGHEGSAMYPSDREALVVRAWGLMESESPTEMVPFHSLSSEVGDLD